MHGVQTDAKTVVLEKVRQLTAFPERVTGPSTEIYYDARISGDDLWDLITDLRAEFGTDFSRMKLMHFAPGEGAELLRPLKAWFGGRPYRNLTIADLVRAVERGQWRDD